MGENKGFDQKDFEFSNGLKATIEATKGKYFRNKDYLFWRYVHTYGLDELLLTSEIPVLRLLSAILDKPYKVNTIKDDDTGKFTEEFKFDKSVERILDECTYPEIESLIYGSLELNNIDPNKLATQKAD